jgi:cation diffusion facilitator CzcD-associated flavoprotein CzcO
LSREIVDIAIIGAGPYGLSLAAHLAPTQRSVRIFGQPMRSWTHHMPQGMSLKSEGFASDLYDPESKFPLKAYCAEKRIDYADVALPVKLDTFINYGLEFQKRFVPGLENTQIVGLARRDNLFELTTASGEIARARAVVVAAGITHFGYLPPIFSGVRDGLISHSVQHSDLSGFKGKRVGVIGGGASAIDIAVILQQQGVDVELIARTPTLLFHDPPVEPRSFWDSVKAPRSGLGTDWRSRLATDFPMVFYALPEKLRHRAVARHLGPAPCWFTREAVVGHLPMHLGAELTQVSESSRGVKIGIRQSGQAPKELEFDHVIASTGYRVALSRLQFIDKDLQSAIRTAAQTPLLDRHFESSVPGLYFIGITSANNFGPMLRFAYGAKFAAKRLTARLVQRLVRS